MTARAMYNGHPIEWRNQRWIYSDTGELLYERPCAACNRQQQQVYVKIPADLSHTGSAYFRSMAIDACIAPIIQALQQAGIDMRGSCCGHGGLYGSIRLQDGRVMFIFDNWQIADHIMRGRHG